MSTIYDVAKVAGVSISTVSHVLNRTRYVSEETQVRVLNAVEQLNYRPNSLARALVRQETQTIALIVPDNVNPFFAELARAVENYGFDAGYSFILCNSDRSMDKEVAYLDMLISKRVDGLVYMTSHYSEERLQRLRQEKIAVVVFDREYKEFDAILLDNYGGGCLATNHLIALGHRRIACISGPYDSEGRSGDRVRGYKDALCAAGLSIDDDLILTGDWTYQSGQEAANVLINLDDPPTAIFACNDTMAVGVLASLREYGLDVPGSVSVIGFDNIALSSYISPPLTTVATPIVEVGQQLCQLLFNRIGGLLPSSPQHITIPGDLVIRASTAPVHAST